MNEIVQAPPTSGKVIMTTSFGELDIELWCKECPKACKNFIQLCMEGYYNESMFHRLIPNFMIQGGQPKGSQDGEAGESIYGAPFNDEYHQRLRFQQRGLLAMANSKPNDNRSQFFITLDSCGWLDKKHTIFGRVAGNTIYNLIQASGIDTDVEDKPIVPQIIISTKVIVNPFEDIIVRREEKNLPQVQAPIQAPKTRQRTKNVSLLSFQEDEEDEPKQSGVVNSHDVLNDPKLKREAVLTQEELEQKRHRKQQEQQKISDLKSNLVNADGQVTAGQQRPRRANVDISAMLGEEDQNLLKWKRQKNEKGDTHIAFEEESESSSSSSSEYENEEMKALRQAQKQQYDTLKAEVLQFKQHNLGSYSELRNEQIKHEKKLLSNVEARRLKYMQDRRVQQHENEIMQKLNVFRDRLSEVQDDRNSWMNHKLKFHIDSVTAFSVHDTKERVQDFVAGQRQEDAAVKPKSKTNLRDLIKLSE